MKKFILPGLIIFLFLFTRLYKISEIPGSVYWDEASIGYNAYSVSTDLKDEWGDFLPLHFRAFGEFKLPVYIYSVAILTKFFGSNEVTLRLPAVLYTLGSIIFVFLLVKKITKNELIAFLSSLFLTTSPWLFIFSRTGYEVTAGLFFFLGYVYFLLKATESKWNPLLSCMFAILSFYSYNSFRILIPIFFAVWLCKTYLVEKQKLKMMSISMIALFIFLLSMIPVIRLYKYDAGASRLTTVGISDKKVFISNYFLHFSYDFLFKEGDTNDRSQIPGWGQLYIFDLPFIILGLFALTKKNKFYWAIATMLLIAPIPAALTRESPHALRAILLSPVFSIISALGVAYLVESYNLKKYKNHILIGVIVATLVFFAAYFADFVSSYNLKTANAWQYQYKNIFTKLGEDVNSEKIVISDEFAQPYIFALYYLKYNPSKFRQTVKYNPPDKWGFSTVEGFGNFQFIRI